MQEGDIIHLIPYWKAAQIWADVWSKSEQSLLSEERSAPLRQDEAELVCVIYICYRFFLIKNGSSKELKVKIFTLLRPMITWKSWDPQKDTSWCFWGLLCGDQYFYCDFIREFCSQVTELFIVCMGLETVTTCSLKADSFHHRDGEVQSWLCDCCSQNQL